MRTSIFQNSNENIVRISALKVFIASLGLPGSFLGLPGDLVSNIINKEPPGSSKKAIKTYNIFVGFLVKTMTPKKTFGI